MALVMLAGYGTVMLVMLWIAAVVLVLLGLAGTVVPGLPGPLLVFAGLVAAAWAEGFADVGAGTIGVLLVLTVVAHALDLVASAAGARRLGASRRAVAGAMAGLLIGLFFGLPGLVVGPFVGAFLAEYSVQRDLRGAGRAGAGTWLGLLLGMVGRIAIVFVMIGIFLAVRFL